MATVLEDLIAVGSWFQILSTVTAVQRKQVCLYWA